MWSCISHKVKNIKIKPDERTAFYDFKFRLDTINRKTTITINNIKIVDNKIAYLMDETYKDKTSYVLIEIEDKEGNDIKAYAEHPLYRRFDVYEENGKIDSKLVSLSEADLVVRVPYYSPYEKIKITETINRTQTLVTILKHEK